MSAWTDALGWCIIAAGTWLTLTHIGTLARLNRLGKVEVIEPGLRRRARRNVISGPSSFAWGVCWLSYPVASWALIWLPVAYIAMLAIWDVGSRFWFRNNGDPEGQAAGQP